MLNTNFLPWPSYTKEEIDSVSRVLHSNKVNYWTGNECRQFEEEFASYFGSKYSVALANGTVAIDLALRALNIGHGDEVIVTSRTFLASVSSIINSGAKPVFVDICLNSQNILSSKCADAINLNTKAILCVHLAGWPCEMDNIMEIAKKNNLYVIEDCAQAHGARYKGKSVGSIGDIGCWSFCQDKIMSTAGEGGMVTTNNRDLWKKMWAYKDHGKSYDAVYHKNHPEGFRWVHESFGTNWRMNELQAAIGRMQLKKIDDWTLKRRENAFQIWNIAKELPHVRIPITGAENYNALSSESRHAAYRCYIFIDGSEDDRDAIISKISEKGVPCFSGSCSEVYLEKAFENTNFRPDQRLKNAKKLGEQSVAFLCHPTMEKKDVAFICDIMKKVILEYYS